MHPVAFILASVSLGVVGQLVLKAAVARIGPLALGDGRVLKVAWRVFSAPGVWAGLSLYGVGTLFWLVALSRVDLGYAYPFISLSYVLILLASWWFLGEEVSPLRLVGVAVICLGVYVVAAG